MAALQGLQGSRDQRHSFSVAYRDPHAQLPVKGYRGLVLVLVELSVR